MLWMIILSFLGEDMITIIMTKNEKKFKERMKKMQAKNKKNKNKKRTNKQKKTKKIVLQKCYIKFMTILCQIQ